MLTTDRCSLRHRLLHRRYPDAWLWAPFLVIGALWWGMLALGAANTALREGSAAAPVARASFCALISLSLLVSAVGMFVLKAWACRLASLTCGAIAVWFFADGSYMIAAVHVLWAYCCWDDRGSVFGVSRSVGRRAS